MVLLLDFTILQILKWNKKTECAFDVETGEQKCEFFMLVNVQNNACL
jgi:hypothetical protein